MRSMFVETQWRVVGTNSDRSSHVTWRDTVEQARSLAESFHKAAVYRPDGSLLGLFYRGEQVPGASETPSR